MVEQHIELIWGDRTKIANAVEDYYGFNIKGKSVMEYGEDCLPVPESGEMGEFVHHLAGIYRRGVMHHPDATFSFPNRCLCFTERPDGSSIVWNSAILYKPWNTDCEPIQHWVGQFFGTDFGIDNPEIDGDYERAEASLWIGYSEMDIPLEERKKISIRGPWDKTPVQDLRIDHGDLDLIVSELDGAENDVGITTTGVRSAFFNTDDPRYAPANSLIPLALPETYLAKWGSNEDVSGVFTPYSYLYMEGLPAQVRRTMVRALSLCENEQGFGWELDKKLNLEGIDMLSHPIHSQHLVYRQRKIERV
ncbi:MAG: hypothetical protein ABIJ20_04515 [Nanoarchaeota archaeon]|nr:hypothetical protein [Nanoarchaeota archaeon]MBU1445425.1 hypothetical protein [Nanoarchaeota archaeon]MBU2420905.1 hypothetical protein [Nanoarchaeota archaeon]MBU2475046.1 hypothetical protein [Nanoarchaeota archaeon]